jgi:hypothetical protein
MYSEATGQVVASAATSHFDDDNVSVALSTSSSGSSVGTSVATGKEDQHRTPEEQEEIAQSETKAVFWLRMMVLLVLILSAVAVSLSVYFYTSESEQNEFETQFNSDSVKVLEAVGNTLDTTLGAADAFVLRVVAYGRYSNSTWPYVTLPNHAVQAAKLLSLTKGFFMSQSHLVSEEQRAVWEPYSNANDAWVSEAVDVEKQDERFNGLLDTPINTSPVLYDQGGTRSQGLFAS